MMHVQAQVHGGGVPHGDDVVGGGGDVLERLDHYAHGVEGAPAAGAAVQVAAYDNGVRGQTLDSRGPFALALSFHVLAKHVPDRRPHALASHSAAHLPSTPPHFEIPL